MSILAEVYASAPTGERIIPSLEIQVPGHDPIRICTGFNDELLGVDGTFYKFEAGSLTVSLPAKNASGSQALTFGVSNVAVQAQRYVEDALASGQRVTVIYREYLSTDKSAPARKPYVMPLRGGQFQGGDVQFEAGYYDILNTAWPRQRYTAENAPGIRYL